MENHKFWFEGMRRITFEFHGSVQSAVITYTYIDEKGEKQTATKKVDFTEEVNVVK